MKELSCEDCIDVETCAGNDYGIFPCPDFERMFKVLRESDKKFIRDKYSSPVEAWRVYMVVNNKGD